jgi:serine protease Do
MLRPFFFAFAITISSTTLFAQEAKLDALEEQAFKQAAALVEPSIVRIETVGGLDRVGQVLVGDGPTTGVIVSEDGYIISSSFNFASKPSSILVKLSDGRPLAASVVATDHSKMLTLLKIDAKDLTPAPAAPKDSIKVGQWSLAMGRTYDNSLPNVSVGIVSAKDRIWGRAIQTDAKVSPVNYGGPLVNIKGEVMGVLVPLSTRGGGEISGVEWYDGGIGFAIPMEDIRRVLDRLKAGEDLKSGLLGISFKEAGQLGGDPVIDRVRIHSPADEAGLMAGDVIVKVDDHDIVRQADVKHAIGNKYAGEEITLTAKRDDKPITKTIKLVEELTPYESGFLGILPIREAAGPQAAAGVGVRFVYPESPAAKAGLETRDRILKFNEEAVASALELTDKVSRVMPGEKATLVYLRGDKEETAEVELVSIPDTVLGELRSSAIPPGKPPENKEGAPKTGRYDAQVPDSETNYWGYVPEDYNPDYKYGLLVWIHPGGDTMEQEILKAWKPIAQQQGLILVGPKAQKISGWTPNEAEILKALVEDFKEKYSIADSRIFLHTYSNGGRLAYPLLFKHRDLFRGLASATSPLVGPPGENDPDFRQQFHIVVGEKDDVKPGVEASVKALQKLKFPVSSSTVKDLKDEYPPQETIEEIARWADSLDRI